MVRRVRKTIRNSKSLFLLNRMVIGLWKMTRRRQVHSHAVQRRWINIAFNDTPVPQTRLDRRAFEGQMS